MILIKLNPGYMKKFQATAEAWDLGFPVGDGNTIREALEDLEEMYFLKFNEKLIYTWI